MVKPTWLVALTACFLAGCAGHWGQWPDQVTSVQTIMEEPIDDQKVVLRGRVTEHVKDDKYRFSDDTGQILVDIDDDEWPQGNPVPPDLVVEIYGEVDVDHGKDVKIDVERIVPVPQGASPDARPSE